MPEGPLPRLELDAPLDERSTLDAWVTRLAVEPAAAGEPRPERTVMAAGRVPAAAPGSRAARPIANLEHVDAGARGNWIPTGPRNITGRVRALAVHPTDPTIMYAGAASGGVFKSVDGGETWLPSWTDNASQSIAGISICRDHPETVWVATGEIQAGGGESILGSGIYRSTDSGVHWANPTNKAPGVAPNIASTFDAIAAHPQNRDVCWAVGPKGIFRTLDGGATWSQFAPGIYYSDVAFSFNPGPPPVPVVFLVRAVSTAGEATVLRIDNPDDPVVANVTASINNLASASHPLTAPGLATRRYWPKRGKIAICSGTQNVAFVRFAARNEKHCGLFRTINAQAPPVAGPPAASGITWLPLSDSVNSTDAGFCDEGQGSYNLSIAVNPANPNEIATGMNDVYVSVNAFVAANNQITFARAIAEDITFFDRAQHADQHAAIIVPPPAAAPPGTPATLWVTNDGGISSSIDWQTGTGYARGSTILPLPAGVITWRKSFGISASQPYSIAQSPLLPSAFACGFQDNGVLLTAGGPTWRVVIGADGGFVDFDPDDPYKLLASYQSAIDEVLFPGKLEGGFALPGYPIREGLWPRDLTQGFLPTDGALFVSDTAHHPRRGDRVLLARENRLYGNTETQGDRWRPEPAGRGVEIQLTVQPTVATPSPTATLLVQATPGAARLGLAPQISTVTANARQPAVAGVRSLLPGPYALQDGDKLSLTLNGNPLAPIDFTRPADKHGVPWTAAEVAAKIVGPGLSGLPCFWARPFAVEVTTTDLGANAEITLGGTALDPLPSGLSPLGLRARTYKGTAGRPATVTLLAPHRSMRPAAGHDPLELTIKIGADGRTRTVTFDDDTFVDLAWIHAGELQRAIRKELGDDPATVTALAVEKRLRITGTGGASIQLGGTAAPQLNIPSWTPADPPAPFLEPNVELVNSFDLSPAPGPPVVPLVLTINDGAAKPSLTFNGTANDLRTLTAEELEARLQAHFTANGINATCALEHVFDIGSPTEIAYSRSAPDTAWVGSSDGTLYRTTSDGQQWDTIQDPLLYGLDRSIEAIAIHPRDADTVYVGLEGRPTSGLEDQAKLNRPGLLFKTTNGGGGWRHIGEDVKDADGSQVGVYALQIDPAEPDTVFAATEVGVFRSTNGGSSWEPFNEGLPSAIVRDLDFVPERRVLRAGVWGRGTYERHVGDVAARDVSIYVRSSELDDGSARPAPQGPDLYASRPRPLPKAASPDIKASRDDPPSIAGKGAIDGVEFDDDIRHEEIVSGAATVFVQIHNRGAFPATAVRTVCLWADASNGPPPLPEDFWTHFHAKTLAASMDAWNLVGDAALADAAGKGRDRIPSGYPRVQRFAVNWPADVATHRRIGILVLVECAEDQIGATEVDVAELLDTEPKAAYREAPTVADRDDQTIRLEQTTPAQFTVSAPAAPLAAVTAILAPAAVLPIGPVGGLTGDTQASFALAPVAGNNQALTFAMPPENVTVTFASGMFSPGAARAREAMTIIVEQFFEQDIPMTVTLVPVGAGTGLQLNGVGGTLFQVTGGTAAGILGLAPGAAAAVLTGTVAAPFNLAGPPAPTLTLSVTRQATVQFAQQPGFNPAAAPARAVRRLLNREFAAAHLPIRAVIPRVDLWVRRSITDIDGIHTPVAGAHLADLVVAPAPVGAPADLFRLVTVHALDSVKPAVDNTLYLRATNLGNVDLAAADSRHRLYTLAMGAAPIAAAQIGPPAGIQQQVPAGSSTIVEFHWNPGAAAAGDRLFLLAVSDDQTHQAIAVPASFATVAELDAFCAANPGAAYRMFVVGA